MGHLCFLSNPRRKYFNGSLICITGEALCALMQQPDHMKGGIPGENLHHSRFPTHMVPNIDFNEFKSNKHFMIILPEVSPTVC